MNGTLMIPEVNNEDLDSKVSDTMTSMLAAAEDSKPRIGGKLEMLIAIEIIGGKL